METIFDFLIWGLWEIQTDSRIDVQFGGLGVDTYRKEPMENLMAWWEKENKYRNGKHCHK